MSLLVVGSVALDSVQTPFGSYEDAIGGSALFFSYAARLLHPVQLVAVVGDDYPFDALARLAKQDVDISGIERQPGESFRWKGEYSYDLQHRETLETRLGVFADFEPKIPEAFRDARYVFLGNINPELQLSVLDQIHQPNLVACDTMNYWIHGTRDVLLEVMRRTDVLMVNDAEARELSGDWNVYRAARWIVEHGPSMVVIKQGVYGAVLLENGRIFYVPAFPLDDVFDPTGAGDAFAGGFMGHLARTDDLSAENLRRAMVYGAAMGSFAVERFSVERFDEIGPAEVTARVREFAELVRFEIEAEAEAVRSEE
ncbi:MAG: sugar kinase [Gemmatimonadales bacterium]|nr:sugar kinase [Gemmatimonadales bacterium]NIN12800.1 sugar kinase [Gemmatimonadales bacterium]NIN48728.1 sugar kinase [Gemmatimonadales bacterium]NIP06192.1 sugar kinase [Gemmatimonadales bacterium]NIR01377.1 sugar kinase [Gemmatimonadales bacterium]